MNLSELIAELNSMKEQSGDQKVYIYGSSGYREIENVFRSYSGEHEDYILVVD